MIRTMLIVCALAIAGCASSGSSDGNGARLQSSNTAREWMLASSDARHDYIERWLGTRARGANPDPKQVQQIEAHTVNRIANRYRDWARTGKFRGEPDPMRDRIDSIFAELLGG